MKEKPQKNKTRIYTLLIVALVVVSISFALSINSFFVYNKNKAELTQALEKLKQNPADPSPCEKVSSREMSESCYITYVMERKTNGEKVNPEICLKITDTQFKQICNS